jgi:hypothetical protein
VTLTVSCSGVLKAVGGGAEVVGVTGGANPDDGLTVASWASADDTWSVRYFNIGLMSGSGSVSVRATAICM